MANGAVRILQGKTFGFLMFSQLSCSRDPPSGLFVNNVDLICKTLFFKCTTAVVLLISQAMPCHFLESFGDIFSVPESGSSNDKEKRLERKYPVARINAATAVIYYYYNYHDNNSDNADANSANGYYKWLMTDQVNDEPFAIWRVGRRN